MFAILLICFVSIVLVLLVNLTNSYESFYRNNQVIAHTEYSSKGKLVHSITCPHCKKTFYPMKLDLNVEKRPNHEDIGYFVCPECRKKVELDPISLPDFGYVIDFLGNILEGEYSTLNRLLYTVDCNSCCDFPNNFRYSNTYEDSNNKRYIICQVQNCHKRIYLSKQNVKILRNPDSTEINFRPFISSSNKRKK